MRYLTIEDILIVAEIHVCNYQFLHKDQLEYIIEAVSAKFGDIEYYPTLFQKAAVYAYHIIEDHIFQDGNKRIGMHCAIFFLLLNGCSLPSDLDDLITDLGLKIANGTITDIKVIADHIQSWIL